MQQLEVKQRETHFPGTVTGAYSMKADHNTKPMQPYGFVQQLTDMATKSPHAEKQSTPGHTCTLVTYQSLRDVFMQAKQYNRREMNAAVI